MVSLHVTLTILRDQVAAFREFEHGAARVMHKFGGELLATIELDGETPETVREIHVLSFPSEDAYAAYRAAPDLVPMMPLREKSVTSTKIIKGKPGPRYGE
jgi:uncharacterized protein (DUF1330 family)